MINTDLLTIKSYDIFNAGAYDDCMKLYELCKSHDNHTADFFAHDEMTCFSTEHPFIYVAYFNESLVGFAMLCHLGDTLVQLCICVHPDFRRCKIASLLMNLIFEEYENDNLANPFLIYACINPDDHVAKSFLEHFEFEFESTELKLELTKNNFSVVENADFFNKGYCLKKDLLSDGCVAYKLCKNNSMVGRCLILPLDNTFLIHDVYMDEGHRGKGLATGMLTHVISDCLTESSKIILHVTKENSHAYNMYTKLGFKISDVALSYVR